jgi:hypothetical protein
VFQKQASISRAGCAGRFARLCLICGMLFALFSPAYAAPAEDVGAVHAVQSIALEGIFTEELAIEPGEGAVDAQSIAAEVEEKVLVAVPLPAAIWLFGSSLIGFIMLSNRRSV